MKNAKISNGSTIGRRLEIPELFKQKRRASYLRNREKELEYARTYREKNPEKAKEIQHKYRETHRDEIRGRDQKRYAAQKSGRENNQTTVEKL